MLISTEGRKTDVQHSNLFIWLIHKIVIKYLASTGAIFDFILWIFSFVTMLLLLVAKLCPTLYNPMDYSSPGSSVLHYLLESAQTDVPWVDGTI